MNEFFKNLFLNQVWTNYIIVMQIPIVLCLFIQSYQTYKLEFKKENPEFKEFKLISIAWGTSIFYLLVNLHLKNLILDDFQRLVASTFFDLISMCFFITAILDSFSESSFRNLRKIPKFWFYIVALVVGITKIIPGSYHIIPYVHLRYFPAAFFDFFSLYLLSLYFKKLAEKFNQNQVLGIITFIYAAIQFLAVAQIDPREPNPILLYIDNSGFAIGLVLKTFILISLSILMVNTVKTKVVIEKEALLKDFSKATSEILDIKDKLSSNYQDRENLILQLVLRKIIKLLNKDLGYYSSYNATAKRLQIKFASEKYEYISGLEYPDNVGMTAKAISTKKPQLMISPKDRPDYIRFNSFGDSKDVDKNVNSAIVVPLIIDEEVFGVFVVESDLEESFSDFEISIIESLMFQLRIAFKNNRLINDIKLSKRFTDSLKQIDKEIIHGRLGLERVLTFILESALELVKSEFGNIDIVMGDKLVCIASTNKSNINSESYINDCLSGLSVINKKTMYFNDIHNVDEVYKKLYKARLGQGYNSELVVPLFFDNMVIGVFNTESQVTNKFTTDDIEKIEGFAGQAAIAIYITRLIEDINAKTIKLENSVDIKNIELSLNLGNMISHRIGNEVGMIRTILKNEILSGDYGAFSPELQKEFQTMLKCAESALKTRIQVNEKIKQLFTSNLTSVEFMEVKSIIEKNEHLISNENLKIEIIGFDTMKPIRATMSLLMEVFFELISNAQKAMPLGGLLKIKGETVDDYSILYFEDKGCGIEKNKIDKIFEMEYSNWPNNNKFNESTGLGLYNVKLILQSWNGNVFVKSEKNSGTTFTIKLPIIK